MQLQCSRCSIIFKNISISDFNMLPPFFNFLVTCSNTLKLSCSWVVVAHNFNPTLVRQRLVNLCEFKASLVYRGNFRTPGSVIQRTPDSILTPQIIMQSWSIPVVKNQFMGFQFLTLCPSSSSPIVYSLTLKVHHTCTPVSFSAATSSTPWAFYGHTLFSKTGWSLCHADLFSWRFSHLSLYGQM